MGFAFFEDLTHEQVAAVLNLPLGTAKTRIRDGLQKLRSKLVPQMAALTLIGLLTILGLRYHAERTALQRDEHALALVTASDTANLCLASALGVPTETHTRYCGRARAVMAVVTFSHFSPTPAGQSYHAWVRHGERGTSLGAA